MIRPSLEQLAVARRLLAFENDKLGRVYDSLHAHFATLLGEAGVDPLFLRSAKLADFPCASSKDLRAQLHAEKSPVSAELAALLFAHFIALITTFIGERLTQQLLQRAWPALKETTTTKEKNQ